MTADRQVWLRRLAWCVGAVLMVWLLAWLAVPPLLRWQGEKQLGAALGRTVSIGKVGFLPWNLDFTMEDVQVAGIPSGVGAVSPADGASAPPLLKIARLHANLAASSIVRLAPIVEALEIDALELRVSRTSTGHYDIDDLIEKFTPKPNQPPSEPLHFALYNLQLRDAQIRFDDRPAARIHKIEGLHLALPFLSNLPAQVDIKVEPHLAFKLNGAPFDSGAHATPFARTRAGDLKLSIVDLDLAPYLGYLPESMPLRVTHGIVSTDIALQFSMPETGPPSVILRGTTAVRDLIATGRGGEPLFSWRRLDLELSDVQPLARKLSFGSLRIEGVELHITRDATGRINLAELGGGQSAAPDAPRVPTRTGAASAPASGAQAAAAPPAWRFALDKLELVDSNVTWNDASIHPAAALRIDALSIALKQVDWPMTSPFAVTASGTVHSQVEGSPAAGGIVVEGSATDIEARLNVKLEALSLDALAPYLAQALIPRVAGAVSAAVRLDWSGVAGAPRLQVTLDDLTLKGLTLSDGVKHDAREVASLGQLSAANARIDVLGRDVRLGRIRLAQLSMAVGREKGGALNLQTWLVRAGEPPSAAPAPESPPAPGASASAALAAVSNATAPAATPWRIQVDDASLDAGQLKLTDAMAPRASAESPWRVDLNNLHIGLQNFVWQGDRPMPAAKLQINARVGAPGSRGDQKPAANGSIDWKGTFGITPLLASGDLRVERFPAHLFLPYAENGLALNVAHAELGYVGNVFVKQGSTGLEVTAAADVLLGDVRVDGLADMAAGHPGGAPITDTFSSGNELLHWNALRLKGLRFSMKGGAKPRLEIAEAALSDFYSRLVITEEGRFNLRNVTAVQEPPASGGASAASGAMSASGPARNATPVAAAASGTSASTASDLPIDIRVGATTLTNGHIDFSDHFVRPNYSAALTELNGQLGAFRSDSRDMATLSLRGKAAGTALLDISGQLNPTAKPLALDIHAKATDLELAPLSPYAGKYAGYAIERGKLSMDVAYKIDADGKLEAKNQVVLNQLTFGQKIESAEATKLPVLLAVALLKDRNGVIDLNLPISGSVNDPQFSVGGIVVKLILNLLAKAITSPFSLLAGIGGGSSGEDLSLVEFQPGTSQLTPAGSAAVDKVAKALLERPNLKMTVTGAADPVAENDAFESAVIEMRLMAEQRREAERASPAPSAASAPIAALTPEVRARLLKKVYQDADLPNKPRNALGFAKDIPAAEMEALLKMKLTVSADAMRDLALQRGLAVRDALIAKGLPSERLFLAAPKLREPNDASAPWTPQVQLALGVN